MLGVAVAVKLTSPGTVFFKHERIGRDGKPFKMIKFRSMRSGSDAQLQSLLDAQGTAGTPLFKITNDPRITRVGGFIRRFSIDELPQLINVVKGDMSLVGPRPQQAEEVELYDDAAHRRLHVRPGMTGLWQVSGRSDLSWEEAIRLDTSYVENWSMTADLLILWRTVRAVLGSDGAY
ncbi:sugar transferase [Aeromicrobium sp. UC242_57]|uniref:sugar transferase n=1 Tax=Aeromicrobium sp. UC242_57 TaxID=3374624 RepID=UPI0037AF3C52